MTFPILRVAHKRVRRKTLDIDFLTRKGKLIPGEQINDGVVVDSSCHTDLQRRTVFGTHCRLKSGPITVICRNHLPRIGKEKLSVLIEPDLARGPCKQRNPQFCLKQLQMSGQRCLRSKQLLRSLHKITQFGKRNKLPQIFQFHYDLSSRFSR